MTHNNSNSDASEVGPGVRAMNTYQPRRMAPAEWAMWRPQVVFLVGQVFAGNASLARALAGDLCELITVTRAPADQPLETILTEPNIRLLAHERQRRGLGASGSGNGTDRLHRLREVLLAFPQIKTTKRPGTMFRRQIPILQRLATFGDGWTAEAAQALLDALTGPDGIATECPLSSADFKRFTRCARKLGYTQWRWRWRDLRIEAMRLAFSEPASVMDVLAHLRLSPSVLSVVSDVEVEGEVLDVRVARGSANVDVPQRWKVVAEPMTASMPTLPKRTRKGSRAQTKRLTAALLSAHSTTAPALPDRLEVVLATWQPRADLLEPSLWPHVRDLAHEIMRRSQFRGEENFTKALRAVTRHLGWCFLQGYEMTIDSTLTVTAIDRHTREMLKTYAKSSGSKMRSQLTSIAREVSLSPDAPIKGKKIEHWSVKPPYASADVHSILRCIELVLEPRTRARLQTAAALGLGAGLDTRDLFNMTRSHISDLGEDGICIDVPGPRPRRVWLRHECESLLRSGIERLSRNEPILGRALHKDSVRDLYESIQPLGDGPRVQQGRLRNTWIATLMTEPVSLWTILNAAGLTGARTLADIAQFIAPVQDERDMRGAA